MKGEDNFGINISGYINKQFGLGEGVRSNIRAIKTTDIPFVINDFNIELSKHVKDDSINSIEVDQDNPYAINLIQINIDRLEDVMRKVDHSYFKEKYNIAFWAWELETFPEESRKFFDLFNEIWVPSNFCTEAISKVSPIPVLKIMHAIEIEKPSYKRSDFGFPEDQFIFLTMFDYYSSLDRKNPLATIEAFEKAFGKNSEGQILIIKTSISTEFPDDKEKLIERIADNKSIILIEEMLERDKLYSLMNCCECFVSLHRSEGFGLTMAEAMYLGKPVIATAYSANTEFMNINNSFLVKYKLIPTKKYFNSSEKDVWADADVEHAANQMRLVFENPDYRNSISERGKIDVHYNLSPQKIGEKIKDRLLFINSHLISNFEKQKGSIDTTLLEFELDIMKKKLTKIRNLSAVQWKIKFKNFQNKLSGKNRKYFWED